MSVSTTVTLTQQEQDDLRDDLRDVFRLMYDEGSDADLDADPLDDMEEVSELWESPLNCCAPALIKLRCVRRLLNSKRMRFR